jgi:hypothetical protein
VLDANDGYQEQSSKGDHDKLLDFLVQEERRIHPAYELGDDAFA